MAREISLVPDIKDEMIRALKLRNFIFFLCIIVAAASAGVTFLAGTIMIGQQAALDSKKATINNLSDKLNSYSDLNDFLTIKDQLGNINTLTNNKEVLSRTFDILSALIPTGADTITISELNVNLSGDAPTFSFDAQANAGKEPYIDYNVLDSFKKSMEYMRFDYGNYVDRQGNTIPAYCMIESGSDGATFNDSSRGTYAYWTINADGCNPAANNTDNSDTTNTSDATNNTANNTNTTNYSTEDYEGQTVVRIWRTPQYNDWYKSTPTEGQPYMSLDGAISNVEHFESACITYTGTISKDNQTPKWTATNDNCKLVQATADANGDISNNGIRITDSSNGRGADEQLVLRFSAIITFNPQVYLFNNHHMLALAPSGHHNVTDSYVQIQAMFGERAADCEEDDTACNSNTTNLENDTTKKGDN